MRPVSIETAVPMGVRSPAATDSSGNLWQQIRVVAVAWRRKFLGRIEYVPDTMERERRILEGVEGGARQPTVVRPQPMSHLEGSLRRCPSGAVGPIG